jgi:hypothetical protein
MQVGQHQGDAVHRGLYFATWGGFSGRDEEDQRKGVRTAPHQGGGRRCAPTDNPRVKPRQY